MPRCSNRCARASSKTSQAVGHLHHLLTGFNSVLLTSSLTITLMVAAARQGQRRRVKALLMISAALAAGFLALKGYEYLSEYREQLMPWQDSPLQAPGARLFLNLYLIATALHALNVTLALLVALVFGWRLHSGRVSVPERVTLFETFAHYWHVVDVIWIFLYPSLYLVGRPA